MFHFKSEIKIISESQNKIFLIFKYFTNWGAHREMNESRLFPEDVPPDLVRAHFILLYLKRLSGTLYRLFSLNSRV